jgi:hypothetical protein
MPPPQHCRHCTGDCLGECLLPGDQGLCIHRMAPRLSRQEKLRLLRSRRFWRWFLLDR